MQINIEASEVFSGDNRFRFWVENDWLNAPCPLRKSTFDWLKELVMSVQVPSGSFNLHERAMYYKCSSALQDTVELLVVLPVVSTCLPTGSHGVSWTSWAAHVACESSIL